MLPLSPSLPVLGHVSREIIIQLLNEDRNTVPNVSLSPSLLTTLFKSFLNLSFSPCSPSLSSLSFSQRNLNGRLIVQHHPLLSFFSSSPQFLSLHHLLACRRDLPHCGISGRKKKKRRKMLQGNYIYREHTKKRERVRWRAREKEHEWGMSLVPPGRRECKLSKRAERARMEETEKKQRRLESFCGTKEKQVLGDEGIMAEKRERQMRGRATWSILSNLKVNHFSRIKAGFRIPTVFVCV